MGRRPNLFIVGAMRSGTTALHEVLAGHPDVFMASFKEPAYFADPAELATDSAVVAAAGYAGDLQAYESLFEDASGERYRGESSTHYTKQPRITGIAEKLGQYAPDARIVYLVRDPVDRALSHYRFEVQRRYETRAALDALRSDPIYLAVSDYALQIRPFIEQFGRERVYITSLEDLASNPATELIALYRWLEVDEGAGGLTLPRRNAIDAPMTRAPRATQSLRKSAWYRSAVRLIPKGARRAAKAVVDRPMDESELERSEVRAFLADQLHRKIPPFEELAGREFTAWHRASGNGS